jgi:diguanylate cyclase (GGDEF)-like protein
LDIWALTVPLSALLAAAATLGYLVGRWKRPVPCDASPDGGRQITPLLTFTKVGTDPLTGLSNRRGMDEALTGQLALMNRYESAFSVALFDIDHFHRVNDERGRLYGDQMLRRLGQRLALGVRETDIVARYGGEEFAVIMPETDLEGACALADRLRAKVAEELSITISGGVSTAMDGDALDSLMARADSALDTAKAAGRNRVFRHNGDQVQPVLESAPVAIDDLAG